MDQVRNLIGGESLDSLSGETFVTTNPHTEENLFLASNSDERDIELAVAAAQKSGHAWAQASLLERSSVIGAIAQAVEDNSELFSQLVTWETGKPTSDSNSETAAAVMQGAFWAGAATQLGGREIPSRVPGKFTTTSSVPIGVVGLIVPSNTALPNLAWKVFPALLAGNSIVLKSSENAPATAEAFGKVALDAGLPEGVLNIVHGSGVRAGRPLVKHPEIGMVSFTGSTRVGQEIGELAGSRRLRLSLELGGNNPIIVCRDANLVRASHWAAKSIVSNAGQRCAAASRLIIDHEVYEQFKALLVAEVAAVKPGIAVGRDFGPLSSKHHLIRIGDAISRLRSAGREIAVPFTEELPPKGFYVMPALFENISNLDQFCDEEIFGPVAILTKSMSDEDSIEMAHKGAFGLTAAVHTQGIDRVQYFSSQLRFGVINVNGGTYGSEPHFPFGGFGASGNGSREPGIEAWDLYTEKRVISVMPSRD